VGRAANVGYLASLPTCRTGFFGREAMRGSFLMRGPPSLACDFALLGLIHTRKSSPLLIIHGWHPFLLKR
jgi:hypothetical protein